MREIGRRRISKTKRARVYARDGHACRYCGAAEDLTIDHRVPIASGGTNRRSNLVTACQPCNLAKGCMPEADFIAIMGCSA